MKQVGNTWFIHCSTEYWPLEVSIEGVLADVIRIALGLRRGGA